MYAQLQIGTDPALWYAEPDQYAAIAAALAPPGTPVAFDVVAPLQGRLILSPRAAGAVTVALPVQPVGWIPSDVCKPGSPLLYLPTATGPTAQAPGVLLPGGTDLAAVEQQIIAAMTDGTVVNLALPEGLGQGVAALSGSMLAYAVLCPPVPQS